MSNTAQLNQTETTFDHAQYEDAMYRALRKALDSTRSDINHAIEHMAKYPTIGREMMERKLVRCKAEEAVILQALTLRSVATGIDLKEMF